MWGPKLTTQVYNASPRALQLQRVSNAKYHAYTPDHFRIKACLIGTVWNSDHTPSHLWCYYFESISTAPRRSSLLQQDKFFRVTRITRRKFKDRLNQKIIHHLSVHIHSKLLSETFWMRDSLNTPTSEWVCHHTPSRPIGSHFILVIYISKL